METGELIDRVIDRMVEFLESSEGRFWLTDAEMRATDSDYCNGM